LIDSVNRQVGAKFLKFYVIAKLKPQVIVWGNGGINFGHASNHYSSALIARYNTSLCRSFICRSDSFLLGRLKDGVFKSHVFIKGM